MGKESGAQTPGGNGASVRRAREILEAYNAVSPLIERYTHEVCPSCESVCCIDRHGAHEEEDMAFMAMLGEGLPPGKPREDESEPCRHLSPAGCALPRWRRPYRCTWYFCDPLLEAMPQGDPRAYRQLVSGLQRLAGLRRRLIEALPQK
jgi:hypothetical protein